MWQLIVLACSSTPLHSVIDGATQGVYVSAQIGALPGLKTNLMLDFLNTPALQAVGQYESSFTENGTDLLYVDKSLARVPVNSTGGPVLGLNNILRLSQVFGICDDRLYLHSLPRKCKRGSEGTRACTLGVNCHVSFDRLQHSGTCGETILFGSITVVLSCGTFMLQEHTFPQTVPGPPLLSIPQLRANWEYDNLGRLRIWLPPEEEDTWAGLTTMIAITLFMIVWQAWTTAINTAIAKNDCKAINELYETLVFYSMLIGDALCLAAAFKTTSLYQEAVSFMPEAADQLLGQDNALAYNYAYLVMVLVASFTASIILFFMFVDNNDTLVSRLMNRCFGAAIDAVCRPNVRMTTIILLRWVIDVVMLTTLHISIPVALGERLRSSLGLIIGISLAVISGRDSTFLLQHVKSFVGGLLILLSAGIIFFHVSIFMLLDTFTSELTVHGNSPTLISCIVAFQALSLGAFWARCQLLGITLARGLSSQRK